MPLVFAFRVVDCFFLSSSIILQRGIECSLKISFLAVGPKVLFQIGLAILKINGEELLECSDDGQFIS